MTRSISRLPRRGWIAALVLGLGSLLAFTGPCTAQPLSVGAYADPLRWVCLPGRADACARDLDVRRLDASGDLTPQPVPATTDKIGVDCFYVYPTVDLSPVPGNPDRRTGDRSLIDGVATTQAVPFRRTCRIFAPLYRQATIGAYALPEDIRRRFIAVGAADIIAAFDYYLANYNHGRKIVLIGHSQGSEALIDMMKARMDGGQRVRDQLSIALLTGIPAFVPTGQKVGGTFSSVPVCTRALETGCFVGLASWEDGSNPQDDQRIPTPPGQERVCVNPAALDNAQLSDEARRTARTRFDETYLPPASYMPLNIRKDARTQTFTRLKGTFSGACTSTAKGYRFFSISEEVREPDRRHGVVILTSNTTPGDVMLNPLGHLIGSLLGVGLHLVDMQFPMEDMVQLVERRAAQPQP